MEMRHISGKDLARKAAITPTALSQILTGRSQPRRSTYDRLIEALNPGALFDTLSKEDLDRLVRPLGLLVVPSKSRSIREAKAEFEHEIAGLLLGMGLKFERADKISPFDLLLSTKPYVGITIAYPVIENWPSMLGELILGMSTVHSLEAVVVVAPRFTVKERESSEMVSKHGILLSTPADLRTTLGELGIKV